MRYLFKSVSIILISIVFWQCHQSIEESIPDVSRIEVDYHTYRLDQSLFDSDTSAIRDTLQAWNVKHPVFTTIYLRRILGLDKASDEETVQTLLEMRQDSGIRHLIHIVDSAYADLSTVEQEFHQAFQYARYYFPEKNTPDLYTCMSEYTIANFLFSDEQGKDALGIGLDFFLYPEVDYKALDPSNPIFSEYLARTFTRAHLVRKTMESWIDDWVGAVPAQGQMLDYVIHNGKKLYLLHKLMPAIPDSILFEFTGPQTEWCLANELEIWSFFIDQNLLYSNEMRKFNKYVFPGPTSAGMPEASPGQTGNYIGYRIIQSYMRQHPEVNLTQLLAENDARKLLNESRYKPIRQ